MLTANTTGTYCTAIGAYALDNNTTANYNTGLGYGTLSSTTSGWGNTAAGFHAGVKITSAWGCTLIGNDAGKEITTGADNTCVGHNNGVAITTGIQNTIIGVSAAATLTTGQSNVCLGMNAGSNQLTTGSNSLWIARAGSAAGNDEIWIYGGSLGQCYQGNNSSTWTTTSDVRLKKDIVDNTDGLSVINNVKVRNFKYKQYDNTGAPVSADDDVDMKEFPLADNVNQVLIGQGHTETQLGVIAQELESVASNCVKTDDRGVKTVQTDDLFWNMINAIKELSAENTALKNLIKNSSSFAALKSSL